MGLAEPCSIRSRKAFSVGSVFYAVRGRIWRGGNRNRSSIIQQHFLMSTQIPQHLVAVWNPSYAADAMDEHLGILIAWLDRFVRKEVDKEEVFVWWAALRSSNRIKPLPHINEIL